MPKMKTHKSTSKRFRITKGGKGKLVRTTQGKSHFRRRRSRRARALYDELVVVGNTGTKRRLKRLAPYLRQKSK